MKAKYDDAWHVTKRETARRVRARKRGEDIPLRSTGQTKRPIRDRFFDHVQETDSCWLWTGGINNKGYGMISAGDHRAGMRGAHRVSYELHKGPIPAGMLIMHSCDNPRCVNPDHLSVGTQVENMLDMARKGRSHKARLAPGEVIDIRHRLARRQPAREIAELYGVAISNVRMIGAQKTWKHLPSVETLARLIEGGPDGYDF